MKFPTEEDVERCIDIRKISKRGQYVSPEEHTLCSRMYNNFREWYNFTEARVFNETIPFGSTVRYKE